ncbi:uncharacterized protein CFAP92 isoform X2 [Nycticebus coucang]|uniref:uncharacterized protein CFAP92 isoform X2 n=1 Tax=Nycticebus coucang TaxID=9470 RepID=UPI00234E027B|nr:uncharacterized protein CFAP92 isoform X2 [Nycticebus coucang]
MSLHAWQWEDEDQLSTGLISSVNSFYQSLSECDVEEYLKATARAQESTSDGQGSSEFSEEPSSTFNSDEPHVVPCKFIISLAFPMNMDDGEPKVVDMVVFPTVTKVFLDSGVKTVKPWPEGDKMWVSWTHSFTINVTKELLKKINFHKITLRLWDTKDKVSKKARYYRLKTTGFLEDIGSFEEVRHLVVNQRRLSENASVVTEELQQEHPPGKQEKAEKHSKPSRSSHQTEIETFYKSSEEYEKSLKTDDLSTVRWSVSRTPTISLAGATMLEIKEFIERTSFSSLTNMLERQKSQVKRRDSEGKKKTHKRSRKHRAEEEGDPRLSGHWKQCTFFLQLSLIPLLAGEQLVVSRGSEKSANILDCLLTLKTDVPIMTEEQRRDLNPLIIRINCASCLPSQPVPIQELQRLCVPVYCKYQFYKTPVHKTEGKPHGTHINFQDINVIFLGAMNPSDLREYLEGPPMVVEVHDRDRKAEEYSRKPMLFGEDRLDPYLNLQSLISSQETETNPFEAQNKTWDPYGISRVSFADLLLGHKYLNLVVPVHGCELKPTQDSWENRTRKAMGLAVPKDSLHHRPMPIGHYLEANTLLKLRVDITVPLRAGPPDLDPRGTQFGRIIFVFHFRKLFLLHSLLQDITRINAKAFDLDTYPIRDIQQILSAFKMRVKIQEQQHLDVLTGFHLLDGKIHLFVLEGLAEQGLRQLWESHQSRIPKAEQGKYKVLYNSGLLFRHRLYADLETVLQHVHLFQPVSQLVRQAALYVRKSVPRRAFQALARIYEICHNSTNLREVIVRDLLPSSAMIKDLSQEFGMPLSQEAFTDENLLALPTEPAPNLEDFPRRNSTLSSEIQAHQKKYLRWRSTMMLKSKASGSLVQKNIMEAYQVSKQPSKSLTKVIKISAPANKAVYNYSTQALNSTELAKKELYREMAKEPRKRFTYSQNYLSAMVEPLDLKEEEKKAQMKSRQAWLTAGGFQLTGLKSSADSNYQYHMLPLIRDQTEEWQEKALFNNKLKPVLDRERWSWGQRHLDFDLYKKPPPFFELPPPAPLKPVTGRKTKGVALSPSSTDHQSPQQHLCVPP